MTRFLSAHQVTLIDTSPMQEGLMNAALANGMNMTGKRFFTSYKWGIVLKDDKHYLINSEGVGVASPLEDEKGSILWYEHTYNPKTGKLISADMTPTAATRFSYAELLEENCLTEESVPLNEFIHTFGRRLDDNFYLWENFLSGITDNV